MLSWVLGVTLGLVLGVALLILTPRLMAGQSQAAAEGTVAEGASAQGGTEGAAPTEATTTSGGGGTAENTQVPAPVQGTSETMTGDGTTGTETTSSSPGTPPNAENAENEKQTEETKTGTAAGGEGPADMAGENGDGANTGSTSDMAAGGTASGDAAAGQTVFVSNCGGCHGANAQGGLGPSLVAADGPKSWTLEQFGAAVHEGRAPDRELAPTMPRFSKQQISDQQLADIYAYLKSL